MHRFRESGMGWYCDGSIHYGVVWDAGAYSIGYQNAAQQTGSKLLPKTSPMVQFDKNTAPVLHGNLRMAARSFSITWSFSLTWKFIYYEKSSILTRFVCTPIWPVFHCSVYQYGGGGGEERLGIFFSCGNNSLYSLSTHPLMRVPHVLRLNSPLSPTQPFFVLSRNAPRHCEKAQRTADCRLIELELRKVFGQSSL